MNKRKISSKSFILIFCFLLKSYAISPSFWNCCCCLSDNDSIEGSIDISSNSETTSIDSCIQSLENQLLPCSPSSMLLSTTQTMSQPDIREQVKRPFNLNLEEYSKKKNDINKKLELLDQEFKPLLLNNSSNFNMYNEMQYEYSMIQREIFKQDLPVLQIQLLEMINGIDIRQIQAQEHQKIIRDIEMVANQCDPEHKLIISTWLTTFLNDEIRERKLIVNYATNYIKEEILSLFKADDFQISKLDNKTNILISRLQQNISNHDSVREKEIKKYLDKEPFFQKTIINIFAELFIQKAYPDL